MRLAVGDTIPLVLQLENGDTGEHPQASLYEDDGTLIGTYDLAHVALGSYTNTTRSMPNKPFVTAVYRVFDDAGHTSESSQHGRVVEIFEQSRIEGLAGRNQVLTALTKNANGDMLTGRLRVYDTLANSLIDDGVAGLIGEYNTVATYDGNNSMDDYKMTEVGS